MSCLHCHCHSPQGLLYQAIDPAALLQHIQTVEDADYLRGQLRGLGLVAFIGNHSVLPRTSGALDTPMRLATTTTSSGAGAGAASTLNGAIPFASPPSMQVQVQLPNRGVVAGMGVSRGVTLIVGGGFHGKSTLLKAIEAGVYNHIPGGWVGGWVRGKEGRRVIGEKNMEEEWVRIMSCLMACGSIFENKMYMSSNLPILIPMLLVICGTICLVIVIVIALVLVCFCLALCE